MKIVETAVALRAELAGQRVAGAIVGLVPTMGALHEGHLSLVRAARTRCDVVVVSIFVNPLQFGPDEDLASYPRPREHDLELAAAEKVDVVFFPSVAEMYPADRSTVVEVGPLGEVLEGAERPGHFSGVATVVAKLFNLVDPDIAFFGQKDAQQAAVIKRFVADLSFDVQIEVRATVRDSDGLALSSRNAYLTPSQRLQALALHQALREGEAVVTETGDIDRAEKKMWEILSVGDLVPDYTRCVDPETFLDPQPGGPVLLMVAARIGTTRLIDNVLATTDGGG
jgi:pantoate--beta-alanine ligase